MASTRPVCHRCEKMMPHAGKGSPYCAPCQEILFVEREGETARAGGLSTVQAAYMESLFLRAVEDRIRRLTALNQENGQRLRLRHVSISSENGNFPYDMVAAHPLNGALEKRIPELPKNERRRIAVTLSPPWKWWRRTRLSVVLIPWADLRSLLGDGKVNGPARFAEIGAAEQVGDADASIYFSPTGWVDGPLPDGTVLVAPENGAIRIVRANISDERVKNYIHAVLDWESDGAKVARCVSLLEHTPPHAMPLSARSMAKEQGLPLAVIAEAFKQFAEASSGYLVCDDPERGDWLLDLR